MQRSSLWKAREIDRALCKRAVRGTNAYQQSQPHTDKNLHKSRQKYIPKKKDTTLKQSAHHAAATAHMLAQQAAQTHQQQKHEREDVRDQLVHIHSRLIQAMELAHSSFRVFSVSAQRPCFHILRASGSLEMRLRVSCSVFPVSRPLTITTREEGSHAETMNEYPVHVSDGLGVNVPKFQLVGLTCVLLLLIHAHVEDACDSVQKHRGHREPENMQQE